MTSGLLLSFPSNPKQERHARAKPAVALRKLQAQAKKLGITPWITVLLSGRTLSLTQDAEALAEVAHLDGCYVVKTDLPAECASKQILHARYKDLAQVEWTFRSAKTAHLESLTELILVRLSQVSYAAT